MLHHRAFRLGLLTVLLALTSVFLSACGLSLAEDITPPPNYRPGTPQPGIGQSGAALPPSAQQAVAMPVSAPNLESGKAIYVQKCLPCHGDIGLGDGTMAAKLPVPPASIGALDFARLSRPTDWFSIVTAGNIQQGMPGFSGSLNESQRWDVIAYVYGFSTKADEVSQGKALYTQHCADCHGENGNGQGSKAASLKTKLKDWSKSPDLMQLSQAELVQFIVQGKGEMPALSSDVNESQRWALTEYLRTINFLQQSAGSQANAAPVGISGAATATPDASTPDTAATPDVATTPQPISTIDPNATPNPNATLSVSFTKFTISGSVSNGTSGGKTPAGIKLSLLGFNAMTTVFTTPGEVKPDGSYLFDNVDLKAGYVYVVQADVNGTSFNSDILHATDVKSTNMAMPIKVYETSTDTSVLKADRLHIFFDFSTPGKAQVVELFIVSNPTDKLIVAKDPQGAVLNFDLPTGAQNLKFQDGAIGDRYLQTDKGFGDRASVAPGMGNHQVLFAYDMAYTDSAELKILTPLPIDTAMVMVPTGGIRLSNPLLADSGDRAVQGMNFRLYQSNAPIPANQELDLQLKGTMTGTPVDDWQTYLPIILGGVVFVLVVAGVIFIFLRQRRKLRLSEQGEAVEEPIEEGAVESSDSILDAIAALDDLRQAGKLPEEAYRERRDQLKIRLAESMAREK